jgi:hypothetical protein
VKCEKNSEFYVVIKSSQPQVSTTNNSAETQNMGQGQFENKDSYDYMQERCGWRAECLLDLLRCEKANQ